MKGDGKNLACDAEVRVRYADTDQMGFAYYANYPVWFEVGRGALMRSRGVPYVDWEGKGFILPVSSVRYRLLSPARYDDLVVVSTWIHRLRSRSITFHYEVRRNGSLLAEGETVHICVNRDLRPVRMPAELREALGGGNAAP